MDIGHPGEDKKKSNKIEGWETATSLGIGITLGCVFLNLTGLYVIPGFIIVIFVLVGIIFGYCLGYYQ